MAFALDQSPETITKTESLTDWMKREGIRIPPYFSSDRTPTAWNWFNTLRREKEAQQPESPTRTAA